jgi:adenylate cyclase
MKFRVGISLGDVIHDEQRVYGDGVNIAARLETIAEPGGICLSGEAFGQVRRRLQLPAVDLGDQRLKNIVQPVHLYRVAAEHFSATQSPTRAASYSSLLAIRASSTRASLPISAKLAVSSVSATSSKGVSAVPATASAFPAS